ncbi:unnamed protein product [Brachionus calyciflorus]|uniref:Uncharacterized protein n=1 Tax=Brachionus calyciflorus TaxID=104777 RepID=A0A814D2C8_9BILA|nr:unnamed protein product [Brachionus calyciflorus]
MNLNMNSMSLEDFCYSQRFLEDIDSYSSDSWTSESCLDNNFDFFENGYAKTDDTYFTFMIKSQLYYIRGKNRPKLPTSTDELVLEDEYVLTNDNKRFLLLDSKDDDRLVCYSSDVGLAKAQNFGFISSALELNPSIKLNLTRVTTDFEKAMIKAFDYTFQHIRVAGFTTYSV